MKTKIILLTALCSLVTYATVADSAATNAKFPERVFWGDEHVHTGWSADAGLAGATLGPEDAVRFARGEEMKASSGVMMKLHRPLDWIAVTDRSDGMGTINERWLGSTAR